MNDLKQKALTFKREFTVLKSRNGWILAHWDRKHKQIHNPYVVGHYCPDVVKQTNFQWIVNLYFTDGFNGKCNICEESAPQWIKGYCLATDVTI
jgi:hypothetical protein